MFYEIIIQTGYYFVAMVLGILMCNLALKGLFWPMVRVRLSFGRLVLVKFRQVHRDYYAVGKVEDGFLVVGKKKDQRRIVIPGNEYIYRLCGLQTLDVDEESNAICGPDYIGVSGFDAVKYNNLYVRTLFKPAVADNQDRIIIGALLLIVVLIAVVGFLVYKNGYSLEFIVKNIGTIAQAGRGVIAGG